MKRDADSTPALAAAITQAASKQTYYTIRFLVDHDRIPDAYRAYAYFRWVDDKLDQEAIEKPERVAFVERQAALINNCYLGKPPRDSTREEHMLVELIRGDVTANSGLQAYIRNMLAVMAFDAERRGRLISQRELAEYSRGLATAVTEAMHYFIGHDCPSPHNESRYLAVTAAHITHMLRDTSEDIVAGYYNLPSEYLDSHTLTPQAVDSAPYHAWVQHRVQLARAYFKAGRSYLAQVENLRCRLAGYAYTARFEGVLDTIERDGYRLRAAYPERKSLGIVVWMDGSALGRALGNRSPRPAPRTLSIRPQPQHPQREL
ncbi:MAG: squalene/phytoene synthase family protein [Anaerolineales bacterium]